MFIVTVHSKENLRQLKQAGADAVIIGVEGCSVRHQNVVPVKDIVDWKEACREEDLLLYVNFLKFFSEPELDTMADALRACKDAKVDGIYYSDEGVLYEAQQLDINNLLIYQPETLVTSAPDVQFYLDQGIRAVSLAHELSIEEITSIAASVSNLEVLIHGYFSILYSRRPLITNYLNAIGKDINPEGKVFDLIEQTREDRMPIIQDETGVHIFSENAMESFDFIESLTKAGINRFRIDSIFKDDQWTCDVLNAYSNCLAYKEFERIDGSDRWYRQNTLKRKDG
jgi:putative protease